MSEAPVRSIGPEASLRQWATTVALTAVTLATALSMCRVFPDWDFLPRLVVIVVVAHGIAALGRYGHVHGVIAVPLALLAVGVLVSLAYYPGTQWFFLPTSETLAAARSDLAEAWSQVGIAIPPVSARGGFGLGAALSLGVAAVISDAFAFRAHGRVESLVPSGVVFIAVSAVGIDRNRVTVTVLWLLLALVFIAVSRADEALTMPGWIGRRTGGAWVRWIAAGATLALLATVVAGFVGPRLPGAGAEPWLDPDVHDGDSTSVVSPLVDIRGRLVNRSDTVLFVVRAERPQYWRLSGLPEFDGDVWGLPDRQLESASGQLDAEQPFGRPLVQTFEIKGLGGNLAPVAFTPTELRSTSTDLFFVTDTSTLVVPGRGLQPGSRYEIVSSASEPGIGQLTAATSASPPSDVYLALPDDWSQDLTQQARAIVGDAPSTYERARLLQDWFRDNFEYSLEVPSGHSVAAIEEFLDRRSGYCEQFAGTFAAFARSLGIPARVAVGFTTGEQARDGGYRVRSRNAHAWPEVWFDGIGWVLFEPTPGRGAPGAESHTGVPAEQDDTPAGTQGGDPTVASTTTTIAASGGPSTVPPSTVATLPPSDLDPAAVTSGGGRTNPVILAVFLITVIALAWLVLMPLAVRAASRRRSEDHGGLIVDVWNGIIEALDRCGVRTDPADTPMEAARRVSMHTGIDRLELTELASVTTWALYSGRPIDDAIAERCAVVGRHVLDSARGMLPWQQKLIARTDPRITRRLWVI